VWAAAWLYKATEEQAYLTKAEEIYAGNMLLFDLFFCVFLHDADMIDVLRLLLHGCFGLEACWCWIEAGLRVVCRGFISGFKLR
jgi:hypothetical protein